MHCRAATPRERRFACSSYGAGGAALCPWRRPPCRHTRVCTIPSHTPRASRRRRRCARAAHAPRVLGGARTLRAQPLSAEGSAQRWRWPGAGRACRPRARLGGSSATSTDLLRSQCRRSAQVQPVAERLSGCSASHPSCGLRVLRAACCVLRDTGVQCRHGGPADQLELWEFCAKACHCQRHAQPPLPSQQGIGPSRPSETGSCPRDDGLWLCTHTPDRWHCARRAVSG
eukprot:COSAG06_NODE_7243_length_2573_cov_15.697251_1_plen_229_part_00